MPGERLANVRRTLHIALEEHYCVVFFLLVECLQNILLENVLRTFHNVIWEHQIYLDLCTKRKKIAGKSIPQHSFWKKKMWMKIVHNAMLSLFYLLRNIRYKLGKINSCEASPRFEKTERLHAQIPPRMWKLKTFGKCIIN